MTPALLLMKAPAMAQVPVVVSRFDAPDSTQIEETLAQALEDSSEYQAITPADLALIEGQGGRPTSMPARPMGWWAAAFVWPRPRKPVWRW